MSGERKGTALAILWADVPEPKRADVEAWASARALEPPRADVGELAVARYVAVAGAPTVIEVSELRDEAAARRSPRGGSRTAAPPGARRRSAGR